MRLEMHWGNSLNGAMDPQGEGQLANGLAPGQQGTYFGVDTSQLGGGFDLGLGFQSSPDLDDLVNEYFPGNSSGSAASGSDTMNAPTGGLVGGSSFPGFGVPSSGNFVESSRDQLIDRINALFSSPLDKPLSYDTTEDLSYYTQTYPELSESPEPYVAPSAADLEKAGTPSNYGTWQFNDQGQLVDTLPTVEVTGNRTQDEEFASLWQWAVDNYMPGPPIRGGTSAMASYRQIMTGLTQPAGDTVAYANAMAQQQIANNHYTDYMLENYPDTVLQNNFAFNVANGNGPTAAQAEQQFQNDSKALLMDFGVYPLAMALGEEIPAIGYALSTWHVGSGAVDIYDGHATAGTIEIAAGLFGFKSAISSEAGFFGQEAAGDVGRTSGLAGVNSWDQLQPPVANTPGLGNVLGQYSAINPGPLADNMAATFTGGQYSVVELSEDTTLYRAGTAGQSLGQYFTAEPPTSVIQTRIDQAVLPVWPGGATSPLDTSFAVNIPAGTQVYVGEIGAQGSFYVGGTQQIVVVKPWTIPGVQVISSSPLK